MNKPPAFQLYADDFLAGTFDLDQKDVGALIRLLCHQWNRGSLPVQPDRLARLAGGPVSDDVLSKFHSCADGLLRNERLEQERAKHQAFRELQAEKGRKSGAKRREPRLNHGSIPVEPSYEPNVNSPSPSPIPLLNTERMGRKPNAFIAPSLEDAIAHGDRIGLPRYEVEKMLDYYESNGWKVGTVKMKSWQHAMANWRRNWSERNGTTPKPTTSKLTAEQRLLMEAQG